MLDKAIFNCHTTDTGNAEALALMFGDRLRFVHGVGWHVWTGNYWKPGNDVVEYVKKLSIKRQELVETYAERRLKKDLMAAAYALENRSKADACLKMAESIYPFSTLVEQMDVESMLLTCPNGTIDLELGKVIPSEPTNMITNCTGVNFNPLATAPLWDRFLQDVFVTKIGTPDYQFISWIQKVLGYSLTAETSERALYLCFGEGANGKSTFLNVISYVLGTYAASASFAHFLENKGEQSNDIAKLKGKRFVTASEAGPGKYLDEVKVKQLTGSDPVTCRFLYQEYFSYRPTYKIFLACNDKPRIKGTDNAIWDRMKIVPFNVRFKDEDRDNRLYEKLIAEGEGILAWMVQGCIRWHIEGLPDCKTVADYTAMYKKEEDAFGRFFEDNVSKVMGGFITVDELWQAYNTWAKKNGEADMSSTIVLGRRMSRKGYQSVVSGKTRGYKGLSV